MIYSPTWHSSLCSYIYRATLILAVITFAKVDPLYAQSNAPKSILFLPFLTSQQQTSSATETVSIHGLLQVDVDAQSTLIEPWDNSYQLVDRLVSDQNDLRIHNSEYVAVSGYWQNSQRTAFVATSVQTIATDGANYAAYVRREMSDPALKPIRDTKRSAEIAAAKLLANPAQVGEWSDVQEIGVYALHAVVRPDGKVMLWYRTVISNPTDPVFNTVLWDPESGATTSLSNQSLQGEENWCASHTQLGNGSMLAVTGDVGTADPHAALFNPLTNEWAAQPPLNFGRYYPSATFMGDGRVTVSGGDYITPGTNTTPNPFPEVWENGAWRIFGDPLETTPTATEFDFYYGSFFPWTQQAPNGKLFYAGPQSNLRYLDPSGIGTVTDAGERDGESRDYGSYATYDIGKVLIAGGGTSLATAYTIDYNADTPVVDQTGAMTHGRRNFYTTILADGTVLATGGNGDGGQIQASPTGAVFAAELWDPVTGVWTELAEMERRREYHSAAVLLPDGRMIHAGGDCTPCSPESNLEIFSPPYLFEADGSLATRPVINTFGIAGNNSTLPSLPLIDNFQPEIDYGDLLSVNFGGASAVEKAHLIRLGSSTHSTNFDQRLVPLAFSQSNNDLTITAPRNTYVAPPGYYMLFLVSDTGVPSTALIIKLGKEFERLKLPISFHDGDFEESYTPPSGAWFSYMAGDTFGGWTVDYGNVDLQNNDSSGAGFGSDGAQNVDLNGTEPGRISQEISGLTAGKAYEIRFNYAIHELASSAEATIQIANLNETWQATNAPAAPWEMATYYFTASSDTHTLSFSGGGPLSYAGMLIDTITLAPYTPTSQNSAIRPPINHALNQPATQSSQQAGAPAVAVDGNTAGDGQLGQVTRTNAEKDPWWQVDLGQNQPIEKVVIWNQTDCCTQHLHDFYILASTSDLTDRSLDDILNDPAVERVYSAGVYTTTATISITKQLKSNSRFVRVQGATKAPLNLAEVQIFSPPPPNRPPEIASPGTQTNNISDSISLPISASDAENDALTFSAIDLPQGLTIASSSGLITGQIVAGGRYTATVTVDDVYQGSDTISFVWLVNGPPNITQPADQFSTVENVIELPILANDDDFNSLTFSAQNLPIGLSIDATSGIISGTIRAAGIFTVSILVTDGNDSSDSSSFVWQVNTPPTLSTPSAQNNLIGNAVSLAISASDADNDPLTYSAGNLPSNLTIDPNSGLISGTLTTADTYSVIIIVDDGRGGSATATINWTVSHPPNNPPTIDNPNAQNSTIGDVIQLPINASDADADPLTFSAEGLPGGLTLIAETGLLTGTLISPGTYPITITADDGNSGTAIANFVWSVNGLPDITFPGDQTGTIGNAVSLAVLASDFEENELAYRATNVPNGLVIDPSTGQLNGTLAQAGVFNVTVTVDDRFGGVSSVSFVWTVNEPSNTRPVVTPPADQNNLLNDSVILSVAATDPDGDTLDFSAEDLPVGLTIDASSGQISGTAMAIGTHNVAITVNDGRGGTDSATFIWIIDTAPNQDPRISNPGPQENTIGSTINLRVTAIDADGDELTIQLANLPPGLSTDGQTGLVSGTATAAGLYEVRFTVYDGQGGSAGTTFEWRVNPLPNQLPIINGFSPQTTEFGEEVSLTIEATDDDGDTLRYSATGLPPGITINPESGQVSGVANEAGVYTVKITVSDGTQDNSSSFIWVIKEREIIQEAAPKIVNPGQQVNQIGEFISLPISLTDSEEDSVTFFSSGLPVGLAIDVESGTIEGMPTAAGDYVVEISVQESNGATDQIVFEWVISDIESPTSIRLFLPITMQKN